MMKRFFLLITWTAVLIFFPACRKEAFLTGYTIQHINADEISFPRELNTKWDDGTIKIAKLTALFVNFGSMQESQGVEISCDTDDSYIVLLMRSGEQIGKYLLPARNKAGGGLDIQYLMWSEDESILMFDQIVIIPDDGNGSYSIGHLSLIGFINHFDDLSDSE